MTDILDRVEMLADGWQLALLPLCLLQILNLAVGSSEQPFDRK